MRFTNGVSSTVFPNLPLIRQMRTLEILSTGRCEEYCRGPISRVTRRPRNWRESPRKLRITLRRCAPALLPDIGSPARCEIQATLARFESYKKGLRKFYER